MRVLPIGLAALSILLLAGGPSVHAQQTTRPSTPQAGGPSGNTPGTGGTTSPGGGTTNKPTTTGGGKTIPTPRAQGFKP